MSYFISFDGFDVVYVEDFVIDDELPRPIDVIVKLMNGVLAKVVRHKGFNRDFDCHFLLYLRDTTYDRLQLEFRRTVGGERKIPLLWIVPPPYTALVQKVARLVEGDLGTVEALQVDHFTRAVITSLHEGVLKPFEGPTLRRPISVLFSWNARHMKRHLGRMLEWSLADRMNNDEFRRRLETAGTGEKWLWEELIKNHTAIRNMPSYEVLEELFLDNTGQLRPQLKGGAAKVTACLNKNDLKGALAEVVEFDETVGFFECILNYLTHDVVCSEEKELPALLVLVRLCQYIYLNQPRALTTPLGTTGAGGRGRYSGPNLTERNRLSRTQCSDAGLRPGGGAGG